jgi:hypothetical protein
LEGERAVQAGPTLSFSGMPRKVRERFSTEDLSRRDLPGRKIVLAAGITHFSNLPSFLADLQQQYVSHSLQHNDLSIFQGKKVAVNLALETFPVP